MNHYSGKKKTIDEKFLLFFFFTLIIIGILTKLRSFLPIIILLIIGIFIAKRLLNNNSVGAGMDNLETSNINTERHGIRCFNSGLSFGEQEVLDLLSSELSYKDYYLYNNIILNNNGTTTQIDHIIISKFGIFILESKDYSGWIFGGRDETNWTQSLPGGRNKFTFQNPIHQNFSHVMAIKSLLPIVGDNIFNVVVFSNRSEFKTEMPDNVVNLERLIDLIKKHTEVKINLENVELAIGRLALYCQTNNISLSQHINNIHRNHNE